MPSHYGKKHKKTTAKGKGKKAKPKKKTMKRGMY